MVSKHFIGIAALICAVLVFYLGLQVVEHMKLWAEQEKLELEARAYQEKLQIEARAQQEKLELEARAQQEKLQEETRKIQIERNFELQAQTVVAICHLVFWTVLIAALVCFANICFGAVTPVILALVNVDRTRVVPGAWTQSVDKITGLIDRKLGGWVARVGGVAEQVLRACKDVFGTKANSPEPNPTTPPRSPTPPRNTAS